MPALSTISDPSVRDWVVDETMTATLLEADPSAINTEFKSMLDYLAELEANFTSATQPTDTANGFLWHDSTNNLLKFYRSAAWEVVATKKTAQEIDFATGGTATHKLMGRIGGSTTANARTTTGDFTAFTLPGGTLAANGQLIRVTFYGTRSGAVGTFSLQPVFGTTDIGADFVSTINSLTDWQVVLLIVRTAAATQDCFFNVDPNSDATGSTTLCDFDSSVAETLSGNLAVKLNLSAISAGTVTQQGFLVELLQ